MKYYLGSADYDGFEIPFDVLSFEEAMIAGRTCLIVKINRPFDYSDVGIPVSDLLILLARFDDEQLKKMQEFPVEVNVFIPKAEDDNWRKARKWADLHHVALANLYNDYDKALHNSYT